MVKFVETPSKMTVSYTIGIHFVRYLPPARTFSWCWKIRVLASYLGLPIINDQPWSTTNKPFLGWTPSCMSMITLPEILMYGHGSILTTQSTDRSRWTSEQILVTGHLWDVNSYMVLTHCGHISGCTGDTWAPHMLVICRHYWVHVHTGPHYHNRGSVFVLANGCKDSWSSIMVNNG